MENSYKVPVYSLPGDAIDIMHTDRGPLADRDPYKYANRGIEANDFQPPRTRSPYKWGIHGWSQQQEEAEMKAEQRRRHAIGWLQIIAFVLAVIACIFIYQAITGISAAKADAYETNIGFPDFWTHDATLVESVQRAMNNYLKEDEQIEVDGKFGKATGHAVKLLQQRYGKTVTGVVDDDFAWTFRVENWPYGKGYTLYYMANLQLIYNYSDYEDLIYISLGGRGYNPNNAENTGSHLWLFRNGKLIADSPCITGNEQSGHFTPLGKYTIRGRQESETGKHSDYYWLTQLGKNFWMHSLLEYFDQTEDRQVPGGHQSYGDIRLPKDLAWWIYQNEPNGVIVVIDDRAYSPYGAPGYEHLLEDEEYTEYADWEEEEEEPDYTRFRRRYNYDYDDDEAVG